MKFSIIIPAHNSEKYIKKAIKSVKEQSFKDYELIVVLDSCTDNTIEKVDADIVITCDHSNPGFARNEGLEVASGTYILFLDSDDYFLHSEALSMLDMALEDDEVDILNFGFIFGEKGYVNTKGNNGSSFCSVWSKAWKSSAIGNIRFNNNQIAEDFDFCNEVFKKDLNFANWDMPFYYYTYPRKGSLTEVANGVKR